MHAQAPVVKSSYAALMRSCFGRYLSVEHLYTATCAASGIAYERNTELSTRTDPKPCTGLPDPVVCILLMPPPAAAADAEAAQRPLVLLGIDPDTSGALAVVRWRRAADAIGGADGLPAAEIAVHDMPTMRVETGTRARKCAPPILRENP